MLKTVSAQRCGLLIFVLAAFATAAQAADKALLDVLLENGAITQEQYESLVGVEELSAEDLRDVGAGTSVGPNNEAEPVSAPSEKSAPDIAAESDSSLATSYGSSGSLRAPKKRSVSRPIRFPPIIRLSASREPMRSGHWE